MLTSATAHCSILCRSVYCSSHKIPVTGRKILQFQRLRFLAYFPPVPKITNGSILLLHAIQQYLPPRSGYMVTATFFCESVYPFFPSPNCRTFQTIPIPPVYSRHSLFGYSRTVFLCRLYTSVTAHSSMPPKAESHAAYSYFFPSIPFLPRHYQPLNFPSYKRKEPPKNKKSKAS